MTNVVFIRSNSVSPDPRVEKEAKVLSGLGYVIDILAWDRSGDGKKIDVTDTYTIYRFQMKAPFGKYSLIPRLFIWNMYILYFLLRCEYDIVHSCDLDTLIPSIIISKFRNKYIIYDCFDFYSDCLPGRVPIGMRRFFAEIEIFFAGFANIVIIADESRRVQFKNKLKKFLVINNSPEPITGILTKSFNFNENDFIIFYAGILDRNRFLIQAIEAVQGLSNVLFLIAGYGVDEYEIERKCKEVENCIFLGKINYEDVLGITRKSDLILAIYDTAIPNNKFASPNKLFEAMMCAKPIIVSDHSTMAKIVREKECGVIIDYGDTNALRNIIIHLKNSPNLCVLLGENGRVAYASSYRWDLMKRRLETAYKELVKD